MRIEEIDLSKFRHQMTRKKNQSNWYKSYFLARNTAMKIFKVRGELPQEKFFNLTPTIDSWDHNFLYKEFQEKLMPLLLRVQDVPESFLEDQNVQQIAQLAKKLISYVDEYKSIRNIVSPEPEDVGIAARSREMMNKYYQLRRNINTEVNPEKIVSLPNRDPNEYIQQAKLLHNRIKKTLQNFIFPKELKSIASKSGQLVKITPQ